jgi:hypothetical protein
MNPVMKSSLFACPQSYEELDLMIRELATQEERSIAYRYSMFTLNLAHKLVEDAKLRESISNSASFGLSNN